MNCGEVLGNKSNRSLDLRRGDFSGRCISLFFLFVLQPCIVDLAKFLVRKSGSDVASRQESHLTFHFAALNPMIEDW